MKRFVLVGLVLGCGDVKSIPQDAKVVDSPMQSTDAPPVDAPPPRCDPSKPFGAPAIVPGINSPAEDVTPFLTPDELQIWFASSRPGGMGQTDIYMASRTSVTDEFGTPSLVAGVNTSSVDQRPTLTADGLTLYIEHRANVNSTYKIVAATRASTSVGFGTPAEVPQLASTSNDVAPFVLPDHSAIYFSSVRSGESQLWRSARTGGIFQMPVLVDGVNSAETEDYPAVRADDRAIYFASRRGGLNEYDIFESTRPNTVQAYGTPAAAAPLNTLAGETPGWISADGCLLYLFKPNGNNASDIYVATRPQ